MSLQKKKLLIDFDDTICQSFMLRQVNKFLGTDYKVDDFKDYIIDAIVPKKLRAKFFESFFDEDPYEDIPLVDGAKKALKKLNEVYDIYICSSSIFLNSPKDSALLFASKFNYLVKTLPFLDPKKFIFTSSKDVICADIIIDDYLHNLKYTNIPQRLLFDAYHNREFTDDELGSYNVTRVNSWEEICTLLLKN